ncbi:hypothetical protein [Blastococcus sp. PRF04-17]|uniref:hypothetical protein n=1 Tax=Blastococcus sp. PRF04-17 TaxID=2933797 RepID=UPI001FF5CB14|nr:hypothetical protein [Blastococcus sp. PRF04-17]UOY02573.1 hypothetical protein MVA48_04145 [Blastococcus sp. PRF04-17]
MDSEMHGDYGYDLAHQDVRDEPRPVPRRSGEHLGPPPRRADSDRSEDLAYDEAHDF